MLCLHITRPSGWNMRQTCMDKTRDKAIKVKVLLADYDTNVFVEFLDKTRKGSRTKSR